jgi:hypothetical protein
MAGELVPLVLLPRFTTLAGEQDLYTVAMDVTAFEKALVNVWRGAMLGTTPEFRVTFQESTDQFNWFTCGNTTANYQVTASTETQFQPEFTKRWFRLKVTLVDSGAVATCWAVGFLEERLN